MPARPTLPADDLQERIDAVDTAVGAYDQRDLDRMSRRDLLVVHEVAGKQFNAHFRTHDAEPFETMATCETCSYYELLADAAASTWWRLRDAEEAP